jgi:hypothetical protein
LAVASLLDACVKEASVQDILSRLRQEDRKRETGALALLLAFLGLVVLPAILAPPAGEAPSRVAYNDDAKDVWPWN